jgi:hypothetical protein
MDERFEISKQSMQNGSVNMTIKLLRIQQHIFISNLICYGFLLYLLSCDSYKNYSLVNNTKDNVRVKFDQNYDLISEFNNEVFLDSSGIFLVKPSQEYILFKGANNLDILEIPFTYLLVVTKDNDTLFCFKSKEVILEYFKERKELNLE